MESTQSETPEGCFHASSFVWVNLRFDFRRRKAIKRKRANGECGGRRPAEVARAGKHKPQTWSRLSRSAHAHARGVHARVVACRDVADVPGPFFWCVWSARVLARSTSMAGGAYVQRPELRMSTIEPTLATTRQPTRCLHVFSRTPVARLPHTDFACAWLHEACVPTCRTSATVLRQPLA